MTPQSMAALGRRLEVLEAANSCAAAGVERIEVAAVRPGDVVLFRPAAPMSREQSAKVQRALNALFPHNVVVCIEPGATLEVFSASALAGLQSVAEERAAARGPELRPTEPAG